MSKKKKDDIKIGSQNPIADQIPIKSCDPMPVLALY